MHTRRSKSQKGNGRTDAETTRAASTNGGEKKRRATAGSEARVAALREQVAAGEYVLDFEQLATNLLASGVLGER